MFESIGCQQWWLFPTSTMKPPLHLHAKQSLRQLATQVTCLVDQCSILAYEPTSKILSCPIGLAISQHMVMSCLRPYIASAVPCLPRPISCFSSCLCLSPCWHHHICLCPRSGNVAKPSGFACPIQVGMESRKIRMTSSKLFYVLAFEDFVFRDITNLLIYWIFVCFQLWCLCEYQWLNRESWVGSRALW